MACAATHGRQAAPNGYLVSGEIEATDWRTDTAQNIPSFRDSRRLLGIGLVFHETMTEIRNTLVKGKSVTIGVVVLGFWALPHRDFCNVTQRQFSPPLRHPILHRHRFMAGKSQVHEPLAVEAAGGVFEQGDASLVGGDQVVVQGNNLANRDLLVNWWHMHLNQFQVAATNPFYGSTSNDCSNSRSPDWGTKVVKEKLGVGNRSIETNSNDGRFKSQWPRWLVNHGALARTFFNKGTAAE